jgi:hypothetical protein
MGATTGATMRAPPRLEEEEDVGEREREVWRWNNAT